MHTWRAYVTNEEYWRGKEYAYYFNQKCEAYPCHQSGSRDNFNCLFCYCPLYILDDACGGNFQYLSNGVKDCSPCGIPHDRENFGLITGRYGDIAQKMKVLQSVKTRKPPPTE